MVPAVDGAFRLELLCARVSDKNEKTSTKEQNKEEIRTTSPRINK